MSGPVPLRAAVPESDRFRLLDGDALDELPFMDWLVDGILPATGLGAIYGPSGAGKSFLALDLLGAIASGRPWFGHETTAVPVVYVALEGEGGIGQRVRAYAGHHGFPDRLRVVLPGRFDLRDSDDRAGLIAAVRAAGMAGGVLVLDTLSRAAPGLDENDARAMGQAIDAMRALQAELGGLVLVVHHAGKEQARGMRGHSSLLAAMDVVVEVTSQDGRREWKLTKAKDGADGIVHPFRLEVVPAGDDADFNPVFSCVVSEADAATASMDRAEQDAILRALVAHPASVPAALTGPRNAYSVLSQRPEFPASLRVAGIAGNAERKRFRNHLEKLRAMGLVTDRDITRADRHTVRVLVPTGAAFGPAGDA